MATTLAPVDSREVVRCDHCLLVQFRTTNNLCRRCHASLDEESLKSSAPDPCRRSPIRNGRGTEPGELDPLLALRSGLSQRQLASACRCREPTSRRSKTRRRRRPCRRWNGWRARWKSRCPTCSPAGANRQEEIRELVQGPVHRGNSAVRLATEWDADVEHPGAGAGSDGTAEKDGVEINGMSAMQPSAGQRDRDCYDAEISPAGCRSTYAC